MSGFPLASLFALIAAAAAALLGSNGVDVKPENAPVCPKTVRAWTSTTL
jgi:hypothetical protein